MTDVPFELRLWLSTVQLCGGADTQRQPGGLASGCIIRYRGKRILLSVAHATGDARSWALQVRFDPTIGQTQLYGLGAMRFLERFSLTDPGAAELIDFAYVDIPDSVEPYHQKIDPIDYSIENEFRIADIATDLIDLPTADEEYGFCGSIQATWSPASRELAAQSTVYQRLQYKRTEGDFHVFALPIAHPGHEFFYGCSGAPIMSSSGALVALVSKGKLETDEIFGVSIRPCKPAIDAFVDELNEVRPDDSDDS